MTNQVIPAQAVEAAAKHFPYAHLPAVRRALESAAPHMLEEAWSRGVTAGIKAERGQDIRNPYGTTA